MFGEQFRLSNVCDLLICFSVPVSRLPQLVYETKKDLGDSNLRSTIVGHVGDGNFHALILFDPEYETDATSGAVHRLVHRAIALDGTCVS
jgi:D-lactate dehydrogenase (cytochrome)